MAVRQSEYRIVLPDGSTKWVFGQSAPEREADGSIVWHGYLTDVTELKHAEKRIFELAYRDTLTGLPNRAALSEGLQKAFVLTGESREWGGILFIDLDQFKVLNDTKGHHYGDRLLRGVAARLRSVVGDAAMIARLGGDEFVVVLSNLGFNQEDAEIACPPGCRAHSWSASPIRSCSTAFRSTRRPASAPRSSAAATSASTRC